MSDQTERPLAQDSDAVRARTVKDILLAAESRDLAADARDDESDQAAMATHLDNFMTGHDDSQLLTRARGERVSAEADRLAAAYDRAELAAAYHRAEMVGALDRLRRGTSGINKPPEDEE